MSVSLKSVGAITLFVADPHRSRAFYSEVFDGELVHEDESSAAFKFENLLVNVLESRAAHELIEPAPVGASAAGARFQLTVWVDDVDATCAEVASRGVELLNGPIDRAWGVRTACFADPDGHVWEVAAQISE
jgi:catechol 2,3-dioxygenase-like lactoylglutathione lyase family enzyme